MIISTRIYSFIAAFILCAYTAGAQTKPIGYWDSFLPYNSSLSIATDGTTIFNACKQGFYTYNTVKNELEPYSKVNGMSDIGVKCVGYDVGTSTAVLVYSDGNIDLFKDNTFYNIPDLKIKTVSGNKTVYNVYTENGSAYLSTALGVIVIDLATHNFNETYQFIANGGIASVVDFKGVGDSFYALTSIGLYRISKSNPDPQNFAEWQFVDNSHTYMNMASVNNSIYLSTSSKVYQLVNGAVQQIYKTDSIIQHIHAGLNCLFVSEYITHNYGGYIEKIGPGNIPLDSFLCPGTPVQVIQIADADSNIWIADAYRGLQQKNRLIRATYINVPGPVDVNSYDIYANNQNLWVTHGTYDDKYTPGGNFDGFSNFTNGSWINYGRDKQPAFDTIFDMVSIVKDETKGIIYATSFQDGLVVLKPGDTIENIKDNSIFDPSLAYLNCCGQRQLLGLALDQSDNLWMSSAYDNQNNQLYVKTADSSWYKFSVPGATNGGPVVVDDNGMVWFAGASASGAGVGVYNPNHTISDKSDDSWYYLQTGVGYGNLPSNIVFSLAKDQNNNIWIGTNNGIGIVSNCNPSLAGSTASPCDAEIPVVQYDQYAGYLFAGYNVRSIAVDGANRKWVGTDNGVWLLSSDASKIVYNFTQDNSPLPSNHIQKIGIDKVTGDVYIGTDQGLVSYRSTATEGGTSNSNVTIFPDPVPSGYTGTIAIKGLVANADVRITDMSGELVYRTKALGGQAVWSGVDYKGHRPQSGVYLVFASGSDGNQVWSGKMVFLQ